MSGAESGLLTPETGAAGKITLQSIRRLLPGEGDVAAHGILLVSCELHSATATSGVTGSDCGETVESGLVCFRSNASANIRMSSRHSRTSEVFAVIVSPSLKQLPQRFSYSIILPRL